MVVERADERRVDGERDEEGQRQVGQREPADGEIPEAGRDDRAGEQRLSARRASAGRPRPTSTQADARQRRPQPRLRLADARRRVGGADQPVEQDGFLEARLVVVVRRQPVAALDHLARGFRVERLVGIADGGAAEAREEGDAAEQQEQQGRPSHSVTIVYW